MDKHERIARYEDRYLEDYGFEAVMVSARQRLILDVLSRVSPRVVLEVGCGIDQLGGQVNKADLSIEQWIIVEPSEQFFNAARALKMERARIDVIRGFFEDSVAAIRERCVAAPDFIVCSGLLNEVEEPARILETARDLLSASGMVHVNVPNAYSFHRRLAKAMGMVQTEDQLTGRNRQLAQYRVFDFGSLIELVTKAGFRVVEKGGYFLKPFTHAQMESLGGLLTSGMLDGLWQLGREMPELASEIYVNLEPA
jgi:SAM-dependent methyltransferase